MVLQEDHGPEAAQALAGLKPWRPRSRRPRSRSREPRLLIAAIPAGIESWLNPAVLEKTSTWALGLGFAAGSVEQAISPAAARPSRSAEAATIVRLAEIRKARLWRT